MPAVQLAMEYVRHTHQAVRRHWRYSLAFFAAVMLLTLGGSQFLPPSYYSDAHLLVRFGRAADVNPPATAGPVTSLDDTRESEINALLEVLRSRSLLERVVESIGPENILAGRAAESPRPITPQLAESDSYSRDPRFQQALAKLDKLVSIVVPPNTHNIIVGCTADRPELAQQVVATLVSLYMDSHLGVHRTTGSHASPETTGILEKQSSDVAGMLREAKNEGNVATIDVQRKLLEGQIGDLEGQLLANSGDLTSAEAKIADLAKAIGGGPEQNSPLSADTPSQRVDEMRQELSRIETKEQALATKYSDKHPQILAIRDTIAQLKDTLAQQAHLNETTTLNSLRGRAARLTEQKSQLAAKLKQLNSQHSQLAQIQREFEQAESRSRASADKQEQARINDNLGKEPILSITVVQPASLVARPIGPQKIHVLGLGMVVGLLGGVGVALFAAMVNPILRRLSDIELLLQIPVIGRVRVGSA